MKVLFFIDCMTSGGKERRLTELMKALKSHKEIEFELAVMSSEIHYKEVFELDIPIHYLIRKTRRDINIINKLYRLCKIIKPDVLHCWDSMTAVLSVLVCFILDIKLINGMVVDTPSKRNIFNKHWFRAKLTFPFSYTIVGNSMAGLAAYKAPKSKSVCIFNGFNFDRINSIFSVKIIRDQLNINTKYVIGMVASYSHLKDYETYYKAAQLLLCKRNDLTFLAIGKDTDSNRSKELIQNELMQYFRLLGSLSGVESYINSMDVCVLSTFTEGISNSILEYMALGKPVIATDGGGTSEIVDNQKTGFLIQPCSPELLVEKIEDLIDNGELREKMGLAGLERVQNYFSIEIMVNKYISIYENSICA
jgi:glycosyltransferase involved in cell wall biosynthesis